MGSPAKDGPDSVARGYMWATRASSIALTAVVPAGLGYWLDQRWGTTPWLLIVGAGLGLTVMLVDLIKLTQPRPPRSRPTSPPDSPKT